MIEKERKVYELFSLFFQAETLLLLVPESKLFVDKKNCNGEKFCEKKKIDRAGKVVMLHHPSHLMAALKRTEQKKASYRI